MENEKLLKAKLREELPAEIFTPKPLWALLVIPIVGLIIAGSIIVVVAPLPWYVAVFCSLIIGHLYASLTFVGHDIAHGASIRPGKLQEIIVYLSFAIYGISPHLWREWHHKAHHGQTNVEGRDPDNFGTLDEFRTYSTWRKIMYKLAPGSGHWFSSIYLLLFFTLQAQGVLWVKSKALPDFAYLRRRRAILDTILLTGFWVALSILTGLKGFLLIVLIPMLVSNFIVMSYIVITHMLNPMVPSRDTLKTSMSVTTNRVFDILHLHFSHHLEHHLFPTMCSRYYPLVRQGLRRYLGDEYLAPSHWQALVTLFRTPRVYDGHQVLVDPFKGRRVEITDVIKSLRLSALAPAHNRDAEDYSQATGD